MVVDRLENIEKYASLNPLFAQAIEFLKSHDLNALEVGKTELKGKELLVNVAQTKPKTKEDAKLETHRDFIDIQIPLSGTEIMGYTAEKDCVPAELPTMQRKILLSFPVWQRAISKLNRACLPFSFHKTDTLPASLRTV